MKPQKTENETGRRNHFDLADGLLVIGVAAMLVGIYLIGGGPWLLLAVGLLMVGVALRLWQSAR